MCFNCFWYYKSLCTSTGSYGSCYETSRLPSLPEEEESQQQLYGFNENNNCIKEVSAIGYFILMYKQLTMYISLRMSHRKNHKQGLQSLMKG